MKALWTNDVKPESSIKKKKINVFGFLRGRKHQEVIRIFLLLDLTNDKYHSLISYDILGP